MLFNSLAFVFFYLPVVLLGFFALGRRSPLAAAAWLALALGWWGERRAHRRTRAALDRERATTAAAAAPVAAAPAKKPRREGLDWLSCMVSPLRV